MHAARTASRGEDWDKSIYSRLNGARDKTELESRISEMRRRIDQAAWSIRKRKGWG